MVVKGDFFMRHTAKNFKEHAKKYLTTKEISDLTGIPRSTVYRFVRRLDAEQIDRTGLEMKIHFQAICDLLHEKICPECHETFYTFRANKEFCKRKHMHRYNFRKWKKAQSDDL
jgi:excisionase family DNA binding protein